MRFGGVLAVSILWASVCASAAGAEPVSVATYNVAGLPTQVTPETPEVNNALISPLLNQFDLALVQEDFFYHADLIAEDTHPYLSVKDTTDVPGLPMLMLGDGLNRMSWSPFEAHTRVTWNDCFGELSNGSDCLAPKGFSVARHEIVSGHFVDVYNLHSDAGSEPPDLEARRANLRQLYTYIQANSSGEAVIVMGDTNSRYTREGDVLPEFLDETGLQDVWIELVRSGDLPPIGPSLSNCVDGERDVADCEVVDKIFYRASQALPITALAYEVLDTEFVDELGEPLSDHYPVHTVFEIPEPSIPASLLAALAALGFLATRRGSELAKAVHSAAGAPTRVRASCTECGDSWTGPGGRPPASRCWYPSPSRCSGLGAAEGERGGGLRSFFRRGAG